MSFHPTVLTQNSFSTKRRTNSCRVKVNEIELPAYKEAHPVVRESIMNYDQHVYAVDDVNERDCSPHPLDIMAVWALYQQTTP